MNVLTGGPSCGKSTLIESLRRRGFPILEEIAREFIRKRGSFPSEKRDIQEFQISIFKEQLRRESLLEGGAFLDRGVGDFFAYCNHMLGYVPKEIKIDFSKRYNKVFVLDRLPFVDDGLRIERGNEEAEKIHSLIVESYQMAGYDLVFVPVMDVNKRTDFVLKRLK